MTLTAPANVANAVRLMWLFWALGTAIVTFRLAQAVQLAGISVPLIVMSLLAFTALALLIRAVSRGRNWARITYSALVACASLLMVQATLRTPQDVAAVRVLLTALLVVGYLVIIWLLFRADSSAWFKRDKTGQT